MMTLGTSFRICVLAALTSALMADSGGEQPVSASDSVNKGWTIDTSILYWNAKIDGSQYGQQISLKGLPFDPVSPQLIANVKANNIPYKTWDAGFQVGLGYVFNEREQWHTRLLWTRFRTESSGSAKTDNYPDEYIAPVWIPFLLSSMTDRAYARWNLHYDTLDLDLSRSFFVGKWLSLAPKLGLRGAWIQQNYLAKYRGIFPFGSDTLIGNTSFRSYQEFKGVGLKIGSDLKFHLCKHLSFLGNLSGAVLWGSHCLTEKIKGFIVPGSPVLIPETVNLKAPSNRLRTNLEGNIGFEWQSYFHQETYRFGISALYTFSYWLRQNMKMNELIIATQSNQSSTNKIDNTGDLQIQGLTLNVEFDF